MSIQPKHKYTAAEYLALERDSQIKHEYLNGEIFAMVGASLNHNLITSNLNGELRQQLKGRGCAVVAGDMRIKIPMIELYTYPDLAVICGKPELEKIEGVETLLNPVLIAEVLSPSTEDYDKGKKFDWYREIRSLKEYLIVAQDKVHVLHYVRQSDDKWILSETKDLASSIRLKVTDCELLLTEIYYLVTFE